MGNGIAQVAATAGFEVGLNDIKDELSCQGAGRHRGLPGPDVKNGQDFQETKGLDPEENRLHRGSRKSGFRRDLVSSGAGNIELKKEVFRKLDRLTGAETILASNTSSTASRKSPRRCRTRRGSSETHFFQSPRHDEADRCGAGAGNVGRRRCADQGFRRRLAKEVRGMQGFAGVYQHQGPRGPSPRVLPASGGRRRLEGGHRHNPEACLRGHPMGQFERRFLRAGHRDSDL